MKQFILQRNGMQPIITNTFPIAARAAIDHVVGEGWSASIVHEGEEVLAVREGMDNKVRVTSTIVIPDGFPDCFEAIIGGWVPSEVSHTTE